MLKLLISDDEKLKCAAEVHGLGSAQTIIYETSAT